MIVIKHMTLLHLLIAACLVSGCCTATKDAQDQVARFKVLNAELQNEIERLRTDLKQCDKQSARLQMELVHKEAELSRSSATNLDSTKEIATTLRTPVTNTKVETVAYLAEVTTELESVRALNSAQHQKRIAKVENLLVESNRELERERFSRATQLAARALELITKIRASGEKKEQRKEATYNDFLFPLRLQVVRRGNVRETPDIKGALMTTLNAQSQVVAHGYQGRWIKVTLQDDRLGWMHYSLLELPDNTELEK